MTVLESLRRDLVELGLDRFKKPPEDLVEYIKRRSAEVEDETK